MIINIVMVIKYRRTSHVARIEEGRSVFKILKSKPTGKRPLCRGLGVDGRTILECTLNK